MARSSRFGLSALFVLSSSGALLGSAVGCSAIGRDGGVELDGAVNHAVAGDVMGINVATDMPGGAAVAKLGAGWARVELVDHSSGPELSGDAVMRVQNTLDDYHKAGIKVLLVVDYATLEGYHGGGVVFCPAPQGDWEGWRAGFLSRVEHAARVFGDQVDAWQVWNEPDHPCGAAAGYEPGMPGSVFGPLQRDAYGRIKQFSSSPVVTGGLASGNSGYIDDMLAATGGSVADYADGIAIQIYGVVPNDSWCAPGGLAQNEGNLNCAWGRLGGKVEEYGGKTGLPVWVTEVGLKTTDTAKQAQYLEDAHAAFASANADLAHVFWFAYSDAMVAPFGLTDYQWNPKPDVYARYQKIAGVAVDDGGSADQGGEPAQEPPKEEPPQEPPQEEPPQEEPPQEEPQSLSCGDLAAKNGWQEAYCEWNGNGACGGSGTPTYDCDFCCEVP